MRFLVVLVCSAAAAGAVEYSGYDVAHYGAKHDGKTLDTTAIQTAIDACAAAGGGTVYFGPGTYLCGSVQLRDHVRLYLEAGAVLLGSANYKDYPATHLLTAHGVKDIAIEGRGTINGNGKAYWEHTPPKEMSEDEKVEWAKMWEYHRRVDTGHTISLWNCTGVRVRDIRIEDSPKFSLQLAHCEDVVVDGITIRNPHWGLNTDGISVVGTSNLRIANCDIFTGDDGIVLKSEGKDSEGKTRWMRNVTVTNCVISSATNGFKLGTGSAGGFEDITFSNSSIVTDEEDVTLRTIGGVSLECVDGGTLRNVAVNNITMRNVRAPLFVRLGNRGTGQETPTPGVLRDVSFTNIIARGAVLASSITGLPEHNVQNVSLSDISITADGGRQANVEESEVPELPTRYPEANMFGHLPAYGFYVRHAQNIRMRNIHIAAEKADARPPLLFDDVAELSLDNISTTDAPPAGVLRFNNVQGAFVRGCMAAPHCDLFAIVGGKDSRDITFNANGFERASVMIKREDDAPEDAVLCLEGNFSSPAHR